TWLASWERLFEQQRSSVYLPARLPASGRSPGDSLACQPAPSLAHGTAALSFSLRAARSIVSPGVDRPGYIVRSRRLAVDHGDLQPALTVRLPLPQGRIPELDLPFAAVTAGGRKAFAVRAEGDAGDVAGVGRERAEFLTGFPIPDLDGVIVA